MSPFFSRCLSHWLQNLTHRSCTPGTRLSLLSLQPEYGKPVARNPFPTFACSGLWLLGQAQGQIYGFHIPCSCENRSIAWKTNEHVDAGLFVLLHSKWPQAELCKITTMLLCCGFCESRIRIGHRGKEDLFLLHWYLGPQWGRLEWLEAEIIWNYRPEWLIHGHSMWLGLPHNVASG